MRLAVILLCLWAGAAQAGAWLREPGTGFFALSGTTNERMDTGASLYVEYGVREGLTLGVDIDLSMNESAPMSGAGLVFARLPLSSGDWTSSWVLGLGGRETAGKIKPFGSLGFSIGRGLSWGQGGWFNIDTRLDLGDSSVSQFKVDTTLGLQIAPRAKGMLQIFLTAEDDGDFFTTLSPSYIFTPKPDGPSWQIALEARHAKKAELGIKLGLWREF